MKILHWYPNFFGGGGVTNTVLGLTLAQSEPGADVTIAAATPTASPIYDQLEIGDQVEILIWQPANSICLGAICLRCTLGKDVSLVRQFAPDIVHVHGEFWPDQFQGVRLT